MQVQVQVQAEGGPKHSFSLSTACNFRCYQLPTLPPLPPPLSCFTTPAAASVCSAAPGESNRTHSLPSGSLLRTWVFTDTPVASCAAAAPAPAAAAPAILLYVCSAAVSSEGDASSRSTLCSTSRCKRHLHTQKALFYHHRALKGASHRGIKDMAVN